MEYSHKLARSTTVTLEKLVAFIEERPGRLAVCGRAQSSRRTARAELRRGARGDHG